MKILSTFLFLFWGFILSAQISDNCEIETINKDFEQPDIPQTGWPSFINANDVLGWGTTASDNIIEFWPNSNNGGGVQAYSGDQYIELNGNEQAGVYQDFETALSGVVFNFSFAHRGRMGTDVCRVMAGPPGGPYIEIDQYSADTSQWFLQSGTYTVPAGQPNTRFIFEAVSTATGDQTVGNFLDAIDFKANFGLETPPLIGLFCEDNIADDIISIGIGTWTIDPTNPSPTFIDDNSSNTPVITGFLATGNYNYTWSNGICEAELTIYYNNDQIPILQETYTEEICDNDNEVDLTSFNAVFSTEADVVFRYYENLADAELGNANFIPNPDSYLLTETTTLYVRLDKNNFCSNVLELNLNLNEAPIAENPVSLEPKCDDDGDGFVEFDLDEAIPLLVLIPNGPLTFTYYLSQADAESGTNPQGPIVSIASGTSQTFWVLISDGLCQTISTVIIAANEGVENVTNQSELEAITVCDEDFDGVIEVDLSEWNEELINPITGISFSYFESLADAENQNNALTNFTNYLLTQPSTTIWIVLENNLGCKEIRFVEYILGEKIPTSGIQFPLEEICLILTDRIDLTQAETEISTETGILFRYYTNLIDAQSGATNFIPNPTNYQISGSGNIWVRLEKIGFCPEIVELIYELGTDVPHTIPTELSGVCEGETLDLTLIQPQVSTNPAVDFSYFESENNALNTTNPITNPTDYQSTQNQGTLYVRIDLPDHCPVILHFDFQKNPLPTDPISTIPTLCPGNEVILDAGNEFPDANYVWTWEGEQFIGPELVVNAPGIYELTIFSDENCEASFSYELTQPIAPIITGMEIGSNYIIVQTNGNGTALEFSLDGIFWQSSPRFDQLIPGETYTVYVREIGCEPTFKVVTLPFIANFISPNNDGKNDTWTIRGFDTSFDCNVKIFDRYGKIFVDSKPQTMDVFIWDGKYKGEAVPSGDYWYIITAKDENQLLMKYVGHISVRNR